MAQGAAQSDPLPSRTPGSFCGRDGSTSWTTALGHSLRVQGEQ